MCTLGQMRLPLLILLPLCHLLLCPFWLFAAVFGLERERERFLFSFSLPQRAAAARRER